MCTSPRQWERNVSSSRGRKLFKTVQIKCFDVFYACRHSHSIAHVYLLCYRCCACFSSVHSSPLSFIKRIDIGLNHRKFILCINLDMKKEEEKKSSVFLTSLLFRPMVECSMCTSYMRGMTEQRCYIAILFEIWIGNYRHVLKCISVVISLLYVLYGIKYQKKFDIGAHRRVCNAYTLHAKWD